MSEDKNTKKTSTEVAKTEEPKKSNSEEATKKTAAEQKDIEENRAVAYLSYIGILFLVPLLAKPESKFCKFHAKQGLVLTLGWVAGGFLMFLFGLGALIHLAVLIFSIIGLVNVSNGEFKKLPLVGDWAEKFNL
jgi:uncharacterized membrane protein